MRIKTRLIITALAMMLSMAAFGQSPIKVKEFRMLPNGIMDAGVLTKEQQTDYDGNKVCLIKVRPSGIGEETMQRLSFKTNGPFITHKEYENGEYRLYVSSNREGSIVIRYNGDCEYILPSRLKEGKIYEMILEMETGTLTVVATPVEAKIYVDDAYVGTGSVNVQVSVGAEHRCRVECQDYIKVEKTVSFAKNEEKTLTVELVPNFGYITVKSEPSGAELYIDNKKAGTTPYLAMRISRGQHRVEVRKMGYEPYAEVVTININETTRIEDVKLKASNEVPSIPQQQEQYSPQQEYGGGFSNQTITVKGVSFEMVYVEGGSFDMGATTEQGSDAYDDEYPVHRVTLSGYYIGKCEVTQELWEAVMGSNPSNFRGAQNPVERVSWNDCQNFIKKLNSLTGMTFRLPTEAEWEYAARGGNQSSHYKYSGSGNIDDVAWYYDNSGSSTHAVGTKTANELGIYDMSGNVWEWCSDWYGPGYYKVGAQTNPHGPSSGSDRVLRGGSWRSYDGGCRVSNRGYNDPNFSDIYNGLRLVFVPNEVTSIPQQQYSPQQEYGGGFSNQTITVKVKGVSFEMVYVEGGSFDMGATSEQGSDADSDEYPVHSVTLSGYYIGKCEVTQELWKAVMGSDPSRFKGAQNPVPVRNVNWNDCQEFVSRLNSLTGRTFRLPTEAEWEYAARGGKKSSHYKYSGSDNIGDVAWYYNNSGGRTHAVGIKSPNELGIYDMSGNVYEWCSDWYGGYSAGAQTNPQGPSSGSYRVLRGGRWDYNARACRVSNRSNYDPDSSSHDNGLRLVLVPNEVPSIPQQQEQYSPQQEYGGGFSNQTITVNGVSFEMVYVEGGSFDMGATSEQGSDAYDSEKPVHSVTLSDYYIGKCEVTQELWEAVMGSNPSRFKGAQNPVEKVGWNDCQEFISRLNRLTGRTFRLPTEAEWEYAARGGNKSRHYKYSGSNNIFDVAWHDGNSGDKTHAVGTKTANELGIYDMSGNVWEWCYDWWGYYSAGAQTNPMGPSSGYYRVLRGGSWTHGAWSCRVSNRYRVDPDDIYNSRGLRLVLVPNEVTSIPQQQEQYSPQQEYGGGFSNQTIIVNGVSFEMVYVEGGTFDMGATSEQGSDLDDREYPVHRVTLSGYYIGKCEVTQELWEAVMGSNPSNFKGAKNPVEQVSWFDCQEFVSRLNSLTGRTFRLPTEAEWEYAARGGNKSFHYKYSGSDNIDDVAWYRDNSGDKTHAVGTKTANELGIYDMSGNVFEWCSDWYGDYSAGAQTNPQGPSSVYPPCRVQRGGGWYSTAGGCRVSFRINSFPGGRSNNYYGLRLLLVP